MTKSFAIFPYVSLDKEVKFGPYDLWKNSPENWIKYTGFDRFLFTQMYLDIEGNPVGDRATIMTRNDNGKVSKRDCYDIASIMSTYGWLTLFGTPSEAWMFEAWENIPEEISSGDTYIRKMKGTFNWCKVGREKVFPGPFQLMISVYTDYAPKLWLKLKNIYDFYKKSNLHTDYILSFRHLYKARQTSYYVSTILDDIDSLWSAFEAFYSFPIQTTGFSGERCSRDEYLTEKILKDIENHYIDQAIPNHFPKELQEWSKGTYQTRCLHVHGGDSTDSVFIPKHDKDLLDIGMNIARHIILINLAEDILLKNTPKGRDLYKKEEIHRLFEMFNLPKKKELLVEIADCLSKTRRDDHLPENFFDAIENFDYLMNIGFVLPKIDNKTLFARAIGNFWMRLCNWYGSITPCPLLKRLFDDLINRSYQYKDMKMEITEACAVFAYEIYSANARNNNTIAYDFKTDDSKDTNLMLEKITTSNLNQFLNSFVCLCAVYFEHSVIVGLPETAIDILEKYDVLES